MKAFVVSSGRRIEPFQEPVGAMPVAGRTLAEEQEALFRRFGLELVRVGNLSEVESSEPALVTYDDVFFTRRVLKSFLATWKRGGVGRLALPRSSSVFSVYGDLQDFEENSEHALFRFFGLPAGARPSDLDALRSSAEPVPVLYRERLIPVDVPSHVVGFDQWTHPVTSSLCLHVSHWIHVLYVNLLAIQVRWVDQVLTHPLWSLSRLLWAALPGRGGYVERLTRRANVVGRNVRIHSTAFVEGSFLGDGTVIGPQATVRGAYLGKGVKIDQRADVTFSVLADRCFVSKHSIINASVAFEGADLCAKGLQMSLIGRGVGLGARVNLMDTMPGGKIKVAVGDAFQALNTPVLGSCVGHGAWIGPDIYIAPGRALPNGTRITMPKEKILFRIPKDLDEQATYVARDGGLEPL